MERARSMRDLVSQMRLQGLEPVPEFFALSETYIAGAITLEELVLACRHDRARPYSAGNSAA